MSMVWVVTVIDTAGAEVYRREFRIDRIPHAEEQAARHLRIMVKQKWTAEYAVRLERIAIR